MKKLLLILPLLLYSGCAIEKKEYDYSKIKMASWKYYDALEPEMEYDNILGDKIFVVKSIHHKNVAYIGGMVFTPTNNDGYPCVWAKTGGIEGYGLWFSLNNYSKYLPNNERFSLNHCCASAVKEYTESYYKKNNIVQQ